MDSYNSLVASSLIAASFLHMYFLCVHDLVPMEINECVECVKPPRSLFPNIIKAGRQQSHKCTSPQLSRSLYIRTHVQRVFCAYVPFVHQAPGLRFPHSPQLWLSVLPPQLSELRRHAAQNRCATLSAYVSRAPTAGGGSP